MKFTLKAASLSAAIVIGLAGCGSDKQSAAQTDLAEETIYDIVISNGRVIDPETKLDAVRNLGIKDGIIATISTAPLSGGRVIDATDHNVSPGFVDTHNHGAATPHGGKLI